MKKNYRRIPCTLEAESGIAPVYWLTMCKGMILDKGADKNDVYHDECQKCRRFMYSGIRKKISFTAWIIIAAFVVFVFLTPQGAIRMNLLVTRGINTAVSAAVSKKESIKYGAFRIDIYIVCFDGREETWKVDHMSICHAVRIE